MTAYYNEIDPFKAEVIREAIKAGAIADGDVDERSIKDVEPAELMGYTQCHFFAGGGFWSLALRQAGWPDDRPVWTGSCPCPSFSCAGKGGGFDDPRHLWPDWEKLIRVCRPPVIFGEQADDAVGYGWLDLVQTDLEASAYAVGKIVLGACSVGAPEIRQRLYFVAESLGDGRGSRGREDLGDDGNLDDTMRGISELEYAEGDGRLGRQDDGDRGRRQCAFGQAGAIGIVGNTAGERCGETRPAVDGGGPLRGFWADFELIPCRHPKIPGAVEWRAIKPSTFVLAHGYPGRVGALRLAGDAINVPTAQAFIAAYLESEVIE